MDKNKIFTISLGVLLAGIVIFLVSGVPYFVSKYAIEEYTKEMTTVINSNTATIQQIVQFLNQSQPQETK